MCGRCGSVTPPPTPYGTAASAGYPLTSSGVGAVQTLPQVTVTASPDAPTRPAWWWIVGALVLGVVLADEGGR